MALADLGLLTLSSTSGADEGKLKRFDWPSYMDPAIIEAVEEESGLEVLQNYFNFNAELIAGGGGQ